MDRQKISFKILFLKSIAKKISVSLLDREFYYFDVALCDCVCTFEEARILWHRYLGMKGCKDDLQCLMGTQDGIPIGRCTEIKKGLNWR